MANHIRLTAGRYRAETQVVVTLLQGTREVSYTVVPAGEEFDIPAHTNAFWSAATYHPDFGDTAPRFLALSTAD